MTSLSMLWLLLTWFETVGLCHIDSLFTVMLTSLPNKQQLYNYTPLEQDALIF